MEVSLQEMLDARERRAGRQRQLLGEFQKPLLCFTMNIAGEIKDSPLIRRGFRRGLTDLEQLLSVEKIPSLHRDVLYERTGCEAIFVLDASAERIKSLTTALEDASPLGRLFDMDVLNITGEKLQRAHPRHCLICGEMAQVCARSRRHSVAQLQETTREILQQAVLEDDAQFAAQMAQQALLYEVAVSPKPGLVDRENNGSHRDMDFFSFQRSAVALYPYFEECVRIGRSTRHLPPTETFSRLRFPGKIAEGRMLAATGGVNTHKGSIFSLGLLCGVLGRMEREDWGKPEQVLLLCRAMTADVLQDFSTPRDTVGQHLYQTYGITGIRGQAAAGYPTVRDIALPKLEAGLAAGQSLNDAACAVLSVLIAETVDTNMIHRGGLALQQQTAAEMAALLKTEPFPSASTLADWNDRFVAENLSPGGCADLLAITLLLHFLKEDALYRLS